MKKAGMGENITLVVGDDAVTLHLFINTRIVLIYPKGSDPQQFTVTRLGSTQRYHKLSATYFHYSEVLYCLHTAGIRPSVNGSTTDTRGVIALHMMHSVVPNTNALSQFSPNLTIIAHKMKGRDLNICPR
jgi:hypothetical protein